MIVEIYCPTCSKKGNIEIAKERLKDVTRGLLAVNIAAHTVCEHNFIAYIDKNLNVRDYFVADFQIEIPQISAIEKVGEPSIPTKDILDIDLIKLNLPAITLTYIIKSIFVKQRIVLISNQEFLYNHLYNFFEYITKDAFELNLLIIPSEKYKKNKKEYKGSMIFENNNIIQNLNKLINPKKLAVEKRIVNKFITESELGYSYILLKNEIFKAYELTKSIAEYAQNHEDINSFKINHYLEEIYNVKIAIPYLNFLLDIVDKYFGVKIPSASLSFLGSL